MAEDKRKEIRTRILGIAVSAAVFIAVSVYWAGYKNVDFCDEVYTYLLSNSTNPNQQYMENVWFSKDYTREILTAQRGNGFEHVLENVRYDVHPPLYFLIFHGLSMLCSGSASPWIGISINIGCQLVTLLCMFFLIYKISKKAWFSAAACIAFSVLPLTISNTLLIRMYAMLSMWTALYMTAGYLALQNDGPIRRNWYIYVILCIVTAGGFLTQYYFSIFAVGFTIGFAIYEFVKKKPLKALWFVISMLAAVALSTLLWRFWIEHIFGGYRGKQVFETFSDFSAGFMGIVRGTVIGFEFLFGQYAGYTILVFLLIVMIILAVRKKRGPDYGYAWIIFGAAQFSSVLILLVTPSELFADRYFFAPAQALWIAAACILGLLLRAGNDKKLRAALGAIVLLIAGYSMLRTGSITQIDNDKTEMRKLEELRQYPDIPWVYYGGEDWKMAGNLMDFLIPESYVLLSEETAGADNERLCSEERFLVYIKDTYEPYAVIARLEEELDCGFSAEYLFERGYSQVFLLSRTDK